MTVDCCTTAKNNILQLFSHYFKQDIDPFKLLFQYLSGSLYDSPTALNPAKWITEVMGLEFDLLFLKIESNND